MTTVLLALGDPDLRAACVSYLEKAGVGSLVLTRPLAVLSLVPKVVWDAVLVDATRFGLDAMSSLPPSIPKAVVVALGPVPGADVELSLPLHAGEIEEALRRTKNGTQRPASNGLTLDTTRTLAQANGAEVTLT